MHNEHAEWKKVLVLLLQPGTQNITQALKMAPKIIVIYSMATYFIVMSLEPAVYVFPLSQLVLFFSMLQLQGGAEYWK